MKRIQCVISILVMTLVFIASVHAKASDVTTQVDTTWKWRNPLPQGSTLYAAAFNGSENGIAVGARGTILRTTNGGKDWVQQESNVYDESAWYMVSLYGVAVTGDHTGTIVGTNGTILHTEDAGDTWTKLPILNDAQGDLFGLHFSDALHGAAVGRNYEIIVTSDGGRNWIVKSKYNKYAEKNLYGVYFADNDHGTVVGQGGFICHTTDRGDTWTQQTSGVTNDLFAVSFISRSTGVAVGRNGTILRTTDEGGTWTKLPSGTWATLRDVKYITNTLLVAVAEDGRTLRSTDAGMTWTRISAGNTSALHGVCGSLQNSFVVAVGNEGAILLSTDAGATWSDQRRGVRDNIANVCFPEPAVGYAVGSGDQDGAFPTSGGIFWSTIDSGKAWKRSTMGIGIALYAVSFPTPFTGYVSGSNGTLLKTTDAGVSWETLNCGSTVNLYDVDFVSTSVGTVVGDGTILRTTDGGATWQSQPSNTLYLYHAVQFIDQNVGTIVGRNIEYAGIILRTTDGGATWYEQLNGGPELFGVHFVDANNGFAVGSSYTILRTTDGGKMWVRYPMMTVSIYLRCVHFIDHNIGVVVGTDGYTLRTTDGGESWMQMNPHASMALSSVWCSPTRLCTIVGAGGAILQSVMPQMYPQISCTPSSLDYGKQPLRSVNTRQIVLLNTGRADLIVSNIKVVGKDSSMFTSSESLPFTISPGTKKAIDITYIPTTPGTHSAAAQLWCNDPVHAQLLCSMQGEGVPSDNAHITVAQSPIDFGNVTVFQSGIRTLSVKNSGTANLIISALTLGGTDAAQYLSTTTVPITIAPGNSTTITVEFHPTTTGAKSAYLTIECNDTTQPSVSIPLVGNAVALAPPAIGVSRAFLDFKTVKINEVDSITFLVSNSGGSVLQVSHMAVTGKDADQFTLADTSPFTVDPNSQRDVTVRFRPTDLGNKSANLTLYCNDPSKPECALVMIGTAAAIGPAKISITDTTLNFEAVEIMHSSTRSFTVRNTGYDVLYVSDLELAGADAGDFHKKVTLPISIPVGDSALIAVEFAPVVVGSKMAYLTVINSDPQNPMATIQLAGSGTESGKPVIQVGASQIDYGSVPINEQKAVELAITNFGTAQLNLNTPDITGIDASVFTVNLAGMIVEPNGSTKITVMFTPRTSGLKSAVLTIASNDPARPRVDIGLRGNGVVGINLPDAPGTTSLSRNYPNPFTMGTMIPFQLANTGHVVLDVYDALGRHIATLVDEEREQGPHLVWFSSDHVPVASGPEMYLCRLVADGRVSIMPMLLSGM